MIEASIVRAVFLVFAMSIAGALHVLWLRSRASRRFARPIDCGLTFRGRRLFGENKRLCGFLVLPPAAAASFMLARVVFEALPGPAGDALWRLSATQYAGLGFACGLAFMLAELPNSFVKRQFDIAPGRVPANPSARRIVMFVDRVDSVLGVLLITSWLVPVSIATWVAVLVAGPVVHGVFSVAMHAIGIKARAL